MENYRLIKILEKYRVWIKMNRLTKKSAIQIQIQISQENPKLNKTKNKM